MGFFNKRMLVTVLSKMSIVTATMYTDTYLEVDS